jgi:dihydrolipoamide dehydrogenase
MASELISEGVVAMEFGAASEDLRGSAAHPSLSEVTREAALAGRQADAQPLNRFRSASRDERR